MAARKEPKNRDSSKNLMLAGQLLNRLNLHANDAVEMSATQIQAAKIFIGKYVPDLKSVEHKGEVVITHKVYSWLDAS